MMSGGFDPIIGKTVPLFDKESCVSKPEFRNQADGMTTADDDERALLRAQTCALYLSAVNQGNSYKVVDKLDERGHVFKVVEGEGDTIRFDGLFSDNEGVANKIVRALNAQSDRPFKAVEYNMSWFHSNYWFVRVDPRWERVAQK